VKKILLLFTGIFFILISCELVEDVSWIHGSWIETSNPEPATPVVRYEPDRDYQEYTDYLEKTIVVSGRWSLNDNTLNITIENSTIYYKIKKVDENIFTRSLLGAPVITYYRKSAYPLDFEPPTITVNGGWIIDTLSKYEVIWYYFDATEGGSYTIYWDDSWDGDGNCSGECTADVFVTVYREDLISAYFEEDDGYTVPQVIVAVATERIYIKIDAPYNDGTVAIQVTQ
jgi:hypothetical protein